MLLLLALLLLDVAVVAGTPARLLLHGRPVQFEQLAGVKLGKLGHKEPQVAVQEKKMLF